MSVRITNPRRQFAQPPVLRAKLPAPSALQALEFSASDGDPPAATLSRARIYRIPPRKTNSRVERLAALGPATPPDHELLARRLARHPLDVLFDDALGRANLLAHDFLLHHHLLVPHAAALPAYFAFVAAVMVKQAPQRRQPFQAEGYFLDFINRLLNLLHVRHQRARMRNAVVEPLLLWLGIPRWRRPFGPGNAAQRYCQHPPDQLCKSHASSPWTNRLSPLTCLELKILRKPHPPAVNPAAAGGKIGRLADVAVGGDVVELPLGVWIEKPIQSAGQIVQNAAVDSLVVEIQVVVAGPDLPGPDTKQAPAVAGHPEKVLKRNDAIKRHAQKVVVVVLTCQEIQ